MLQMMTALAPMSFSASETAPRISRTDRGVSGL